MDSFIDFVLPVCYNCFRKLNSRGACRQAERKLRTSTLIPDVDNANVGK